MKTGNSKRKVWTSSVNTVILCFLIFLHMETGEGRTYVFQVKEVLYSASEDLFSNSLGSWTVLEEKDEEMRKVTDNQGRSNEWKSNIKKYRARMPEFEERRAPLLASTYVEGLEVKFKDYLWQCSFCVSVDRQWPSKGKGIIPSAFEVWGSQEWFHVHFMEAQLLNLIDREGVRGSSWDPWLLFFDSPTRCILHSLGNAADTMKSI